MDQDTKLSPKAGFFLQPFDGMGTFGEKYIAWIPPNQKLLLSSDAALLLELADGTRTISEIQEIVCQKKRPISFDEIIEAYQFVEDKYHLYSREESSSTDAFIPFFLSIPLFSKKFVNFIANYLQYLFFPMVMKIIFPVAMLLILLNIFYPPGGTKSGALLPIVLFVCIAHEFGHASALKYGGANPGPIKFGFYSIFPALSIDVDMADYLPRKNKMLVDIGGIYFQLVFGSLIIFFLGYCVGFQTGKAANFIIYLSFINLMPLGCFDGKWLLQDWLRVGSLKNIFVFLIKHLFHQGSAPNFSRWKLVTIMFVSLGTFMLNILFIWLSIRYLIVAIPCCYKIFITQGNFLGILEIIPFLAIISVQLLFIAKLLRQIYRKLGFDKKGHSAPSRWQS